MKPLEGITVLDFSQFLSAPSAALRLADMGAHVIKVEKPCLLYTSTNLSASQNLLYFSLFLLYNKGVLLPVYCNKRTPFCV